MYKEYSYCKSGASSFMHFAWQRDLHVPSTSYHWATVVHSSVLSTFLTFLYFASHFFFISSWSLKISLINPLISSGTHKIFLPSHIHTSLVLVFHMPGTKVHSHKPPPVSSSGIARSLVLASQLASYFAQDRMTWVGQTWCFGQVRARPSPAFTTPLVSSLTPSATNSWNEVIATAFSS